MTLSIPCASRRAALAAALVAWASTEALSQTKGGAPAQPGPEACALLGAKPLNAAFGTKLGPGKSLLRGKHCTWRTADGKHVFGLEAIAFKDEKTAFELLERNLATNTRSVRTGQKAAGYYTTVMPFAPGGEFAYVMTGEGNRALGPNLLQLQFHVRSVLVTLTSRGLDLEAVVAKLPELHKILVGNIP